MAVSPAQLAAAIRRIEAAQAQQPGTERTTSVAKSTDPLPDSGFATAPDLKPAHDKAQAADQPLEQRPGPPARTTSAAKEYDPDGLKGTRLENAPNAGRSFDTAANANKKAQQDQTQSGSGMVRNDKPHPYPKPQLPGAISVDRENFDQRWKAEQNKAAPPPPAEQSQTGLSMKALSAAIARIEATQAEQARQIEQFRGMGR